MKDVAKSLRLYKRIKGVIRTWFDAGADAIVPRGAATPLDFEK
jgi:hypothetical protein